MGVNRQGTPVMVSTIDELTWQDFFVGEKLIIDDVGTLLHRFPESFFGTEISQIPLNKLPLFSASQKQG